jgi:hypothetical protein
MLFRARIDVHTRWILQFATISVVGLCISSTAAHASSLALDTVVWSWSFDQTSYTIGSSDSVPIHATLRNDVSSTDDLRITGVGASFTGDLQKTFDFTFGPTGDSSDFGLEFVGVTLSPGAELPFVFGILTPIGGAAPLGTYLADPAFLNLVLDSVATGPRYSENTFSVTVVPEPSLMAQMIVGLIAGVALRRRSRSRRTDDRVQSALRR